MSWSISVNKSKKEAALAQVDAVALYGGASEEEKQTFESVKSLLKNLIGLTPDADDPKLLNVITASASGHNKILSNMNVTVDYCRIAP